MTRAAAALQRYQEAHRAWRKAQHRLEQMEQEVNDAVCPFVLKERVARLFARLPNAARRSARAWIAKLNRRPYDVNAGDPYARSDRSRSQKKRRP